MKAIVHRVPPESWPTESDAARALLFSPITLRGACTLESRSWVPAMVPWRATDDGFVTQNVIDWYARFARGRPGAIVLEATGIRDVPSGPLLRIGHDRFIDGLARLVDTMRAASGGTTRVFIQIIDFLNIRRRPEPARYFERFLALRPEHRESLARCTNDPVWLGAGDADVRAALAALPAARWPDVLDARELESLRMGYRERVTDTHVPHIRDLPRVLPGLFADAAHRAERAGFDGVELHYAHAYTMASFLSAQNRRTDGYGTTREGRVRLPVDVFHAVRGRVAAPFVVGCRFLADEVIAGGHGVEDAAYFGVQFARAGMDFLSLSKGGKFEDAREPRVGQAAYPYTGPSGHECMPTVRSDERGPFGRNLSLAATVRRAVRDAGHATPVVAAGGINSFRLAESAIARGDADIVAAARQSLADPDWFQKIRGGHGDAIRRCKFTNYCEALDQMHKEVTCQLWDREYAAGEDRSVVPRSHDGKRRLIAPEWSP